MIELDPDERELLAHHRKRTVLPPHREQAIWAAIEASLAAPPQRSPWPQRLVWIAVATAATVALSLGLQHFNPFEAERSSNGSTPTIAPFAIDREPSLQSTTTRQPGRPRAASTVHTEDTSPEPSEPPAPPLAIEEPTPEPEDVNPTAPTVTERHRSRPSSRAQRITPRDVEAPPASPSEPVAVPPPSIAAETILINSARSALASDHPDQALDFALEHRQRFPDGALVEEREVVEILALCALDRDEASSRARGFLQHHPASAFRLRIEKCAQR